jgi:hypothetical protein
LVVLGVALVQDGQPAEAEPYLREALATCRKTKAPNEPVFVYAESALGDCWRAQGRFLEAMPLLSHAHQVVSGTEGISRQLRRQALRRLIQLYVDWPKLELTPISQSGIEVQNKPKE